MNVYIRCNFQTKHSAFQFVVWRRNKHFQRLYCLDSLLHKLITLTTFPIYTGIRLQLSLVKSQKRHWMGRSYQQVAALCC